VKANVEKAIQELREGFPGHDVRTKEDADGGAYVIVEGIEIGETFAPSVSWVGFHITWSCPDADVYPHFIDPETRYVGTGEAPNQHPDGNLPTSISRGATMPGFETPAVQISRRSNRRTSTTDSPLQKLLRIIEFLRSHS
jgi:hypothetical protein